MGHEVLIVETGERFSCTDQESVLSGMTRLGHKGIPAGCRGGGCGVCKVRIIQGQYHARKMSRQHVSAAEQLNGVALACCIVAESDLRLSVLGKMKKAVCMKAAITAAKSSQSAGEVRRGACEIERSNQDDQLYLISASY